MCGPVDARRAEPDRGRHLRRAVRAADVRLRRRAGVRRPGRRRPRRRRPTNGTLGTFVDDTDPYWDVCSQGQPAALTGRNIGDLLTAAGVTWGWFQGGFTRRRRRQVLAEPSARGLRSRGRRRSRDRPAALRGLRAAPQPVPVLRVDREPAAPAADVGGDGRQDRPGEPPLRPHVVLGGGARRQPARRLVPEGAGLPERPPGQLEPARRAGVPRRHAEPAAAAAASGGTWR